MTESDKERARREKREQDARDRKAIEDGVRRRNERRREDAINAAAEREALERLDDDFLDRTFLELFNVDAKAAKDYLTTAMGTELNDEEAQRAYDALKAAQKAKEGGIFTSPNPGKAKKIIKDNQTAIRNTIKKSKKARGKCSLFALVILAGLGGTLYGMYEGVNTVVRALF